MALPARFMLGIGAIAASIGFWAFCAQRTILDPTATRDLATSLIDTAAVTESLSSQLSEQIAGSLPPDVAEQIPAAEIEAVAAAVVSDPRVADAFATTIASIHEQLLDGERQGKVGIDSAAINTALVDVATGLSPQLATRLADVEPFELRIDAARIPDLEPVDRGVDTALVIASLIAIAGFGLGVSIHPEPWAAVAIVGRRLAAIAVFPVVLYLIVPAGLRAIGSTTSTTLAPFANAYGKRILPTAIVLLVGGIALWIGGFVARRARRHPSSGRSAPRGNSSARDRARGSDRTRTYPATSPATPGRTDLRL